MYYDFDAPRSEIEKIIDEHIFNEKYRDIIKLKFLDGMTYEQVAEQVGMSDRQVKRIIYKYGDKVLFHVPNYLTKGEHQNGYTK